MEEYSDIKARLLEMNEDFENLKPFILEYLKQIEFIIDTRKKERQLSISILRQNSFSVSSIAKELGYSRTTFYNNPILRLYIEFAEREIEKENPIVICENLRKDVSELNREIRNMCEKDVDIELLKQEVKALCITVKDKSKEIDILRNRVRELSSENHILNEEKRKQEDKGTVIQINKTKK